MDISIIIPLLNEEESLPELLTWIHKVMEKHGFSYEVILVDDGSQDRSWEVIRRLNQEDGRVKGLRFRRNYGKSAALNKGFEAAQGQVVITMDADLQDSPEEIPELYQMVMDGGYDLVSGWKKKRFDPLSKTIPTKLYNWATRKMSGVYLHDFNCGLKAYRKQVIKSIEVYGEMHRYIPVIARRSGFVKIGEKVVAHQARKYGVTKFGLERFVNGFLDLMSISFVTRFAKRPMHFFGTMGLLFFITGGLISAWILAVKFFRLGGDNVRDVVDQPLFYLALLAMIVGTQLFLTGFLAELVSRSSPDKNAYLVEESLGVD
ncbi:MAG TPA: glycosyltransferase family 2 protein [Bacteroidales bacterium]|nr:glycosyltransferase family 2 protein [Lentimicrobiaceae bacterium]HOI00574.1 glycosyltransferase family 2 protein [Bacteroidales bacterium]